LQITRRSLAVKEISRPSQLLVAFSHSFELTLLYYLSPAMLALFLLLAAACAAALPFSELFVSSQVSTIKAVAPTPDVASTISTSTTASAPGGQVAFAGVNIAGFDFGCVINGTCDTRATFDVASKGNGIQQMQHFVQDDGLNAFRLPVGWQYLVNNKLGGPLDATNAAAYDKLVMGCVAVAKMCIIDM
jgi:endoglucanase